ncbi:MAG: CpsD/CapB family tyrosine-protein kinase [Armatimonadota bacterium]
MLNQTETILGPEPPPSAYLEAYRVLRSSVMALREREPFQTVLLTSPGEREGKTTIAINLGVVLGLVQQKTILADADFYGSGVSNALDISADARGLTDICLGDVELDDALLPTELDSLLVLPAGTRSDQGPELVATGVMEEAIDQLKQRASYVLFDCTPLSGFGTAVSLAPLVDTVFLVSLARSQVMDVRRCLDELEQVGARVGGVVVNDVLPRDSVVYRAYHRYYQ